MPRCTGSLPQWNEGELESYLIEITRDILGFRDENGEEVLDSILDAAGQKGTGKWTVGAALDDGVPLTLIGEAVFARCLSADKDERVVASQVLEAVVRPFDGDPRRLRRRPAPGAVCVQADQLRAGLSVAAGRRAQPRLESQLRRHRAQVWRGGCIIRSAFLDEIKQAFDRDPQLTNLLLDPFFAEAVQSRQAAWRRVVGTAVQLGIPVPCLSAALAYFDGYRSSRLPANLLQAQRDYFGAHTYERVDRPRGEFHHTNWTGRGGTTTSQTYVA